MRNFDLLMNHENHGVSRNIKNTTTSALSAFWRYAAIILAVLTFGVGNAWGATATYVPLGLKTISTDEVVYCTAITAAGNPTTSWVVVPNYGTSSKGYTQITSTTDNGNPQGITDNLASTKSNVAMIQIKKDGNTYSSQKRVIHMHVKGITGVIAHGNTGSANNGLSIAVAEFNNNLSTFPSDITSGVRKSNSGCVLIKKDGLDASKEYIVSIYSSGGDIYFYAVEFIAGGGCGSTAQAALSLSSNSGTICGTGTATFTVSGGSGTGALSVSSSDETKATASIDGSTVTVTGVAAGSATITVTKACDATYAEKTATYSATVAAVPTANAGADKTTEPDEGVALAATAAADGCTGAWTIVSGPNTATSQLSSTSSATATFTPTVAGTYTLRWTVTNTSTTCSAYDEMKVTAAICSISECGNATITYAINGGSSGDHATGGTDLISSATASNTTALGASTTIGYTGISMSSLGKKAAAAASACYPSKPNMSGKIGVYNGSSYSSSNYLQFTFTVKSGYTFTPCDIQFTVQPVDVATNFRWEVTDGTNLYGSGVAINVPTGSDGGASVLTGLTSTAEMAAGTYYIRLYPYVNAASKTFRISNNVILKGTTAAAASACPSAYSFHYGPNGGSWETPICFEKVGSTHEWQIENFTIPSHTNGEFWVGWAGSTNGQSVTKRWTDSYSSNSGSMLLLPTNGSIVGQASGATGTISIWDDSDDKNQYVGFKPDGYAIMYGGNNYAFSETATSNVWETDLLTLPSVSTTYQMGIKTSSSYTTCSHSKSAEALSSPGNTMLKDGKKMIYLVPGVWRTNAQGRPDDVNERMAIWDATKSEWGNGGDFLTWNSTTSRYEGYVSSTTSTIVLTRINTARTSLGNSWGTNVDNQTKDITLNLIDNQFTITGFSNDDSKSGYTQAPYSHPTTGGNGKFRMYDNSNDANWYVHWIPYYKLSYDGNGGTGSVAAQYRNSELSSSPLTVAGNGFTREGWRFAGWNTEKHGKGDAYDPDDNIDITGDVTLYAQWERDIYFKVGAGWGADNAWYAIYCFDNSDDSKYTWVALTTLADCETDVYIGSLPGNSFDKIIVCRMNKASKTLSFDNKWNKTGDLEYPTTNFQFTPTSLDGDNCAGTWSAYAAPTYEISFVENGADGGDNMTTVEDIVCNGSVTLEANTWTKTGYSFAGWKDGSSNDYADEATISDITADIELTAQWTEDKHSVTVAAGSNGTVSPSSVSNIGIATASGDITATANTGYHFTSWTLPSGTSAASTYSESSNPIRINATADGKTITANFSANTPTITLDSQDATNEPTESVVATYGSAMPSIATLPTKTGYDFGGFYSDVAGGGTQYYTNTGASAKNSDLASATTLYVKWTRTVTIDDNGGSADGSVDVVYKGTASTPSVPTYAGHTVDLGYYAESGCSTKVMNLDGTLVASVSGWTNASYKWIQTGTNKLYAHWKCDAPTITDNGDNTVSISVPSGTTVRYTTDGTTPSSSVGTVYSTTFSIVADCTVKAIAYQTNCTDSEIASKACDYSAPATLYTVTFNTNGGSSQASITQASEGASITMPSAPTKSGYTFQGWVIGSTTKAASASYTPTANVTVFASWEANCSDGATTTTTFNFNSGSATGLTIASNGSNASYSIVNSKTQTIPVLDGYFLASSFTDNSTGVITITTDASYTNIDSIKFNSASTDNSNPKIAVYGVKKDGTDSITLLSATAMSSGTTKTWRATPYKVDIHSKSPKYSGKVRFKLTTGSSGKHAGLDNIVIYNAGGGGGTCYYVTYNGNGATTGFTADETAYGVSSGTTVTVKSNGTGGAAYAKSGYIFSGWNTKSDGTGTSFKAGDTFTISKDTTLYAQWADPSSGDCFYIDDAKKQSNYSVAVGGTFDDTKLKGSITGGTVTNTSTESVSFSGNDKYGIIFDASTKKVTIRLSSGTLKSGATIKIGGYTNNSNSQTCGFKVSGNNCSPASVSTTSGNSSYNFFTQTYTVSAADGVIGTDSFSITLVDDKTYLDSLYVSGCDDCTEGGLSYATASVTKTICDAAFTNTLSNSNSLTGITYSSTNTSVATVESDGEVTIVGAGTTTIKATAAAQSTYCASEATYSLTVNSGTAAGLSFATASYSKASDDDSFTQTVTNPNSLTGVTYSSSNPSVATVNETTGAVTLVSTGSTTITARTAAQTVSTTCYAAGSASYTISVSGSASCTTLPDYIWKTGSTYTPVGTSHTYADKDYNEIENDDVATTHITIGGSNYEQKSGSLNIGKSKDNYFLITAASGYVIDSVYFYGKMEDGECRMTTANNTDWSVYNAGKSSEQAFAIGVGTQYFGIKNKDTGGDSPKGVWIRTMRIKVCSSSAKYTVTYNMNGHGDAISATTDITPNTTISAPSAPSADCYTFGGWYKEAACTNVWTFASDKVTNNMTLYAKWTSNKAQVASTDYGELTYTVTPAGTAEALSVTPVDATGVTYKWLENTSDDVSSATAVGGAATASYSPSIAAVGTKYYWAVLVHSCGNDTTDAFRIVVNASKTNPTIAWGNVQYGGVDTDPTYGGGGYTLTGTINASNALTPTLTTDMISAGEGIAITSKSVNDASKTFSLTFGLTAAFDTTQAKLTDIYFELPGNETYNDSLFSTNLTYDKCSTSGSTDVYVIGYTNSTGTSPSSSAAGRVLKVANTWRSTSSPTFTDKTSADGFSISATAASGTYWAQGNQTFVASSTGATMKTYKLGTKSMTITWTNSSLSFSKVRIIGKNLGTAASTVSVGNGTTSSSFTFAKSDDIQVKEVSLDFTYGSEKGVRFTTTNAKELNVLIELVPTGSDGAGTGTTTTLEWKSGYAPSDISGWDVTAKKIVKEQADANFTVVAQQTSATNSLGAITYSSNNTDVATVNSTTGEVDIVAGASGGEATITAEMARSGCFKKATLTYIVNVPEQECEIEAGSIAATPSSTISVSDGTATKCSTEAVTLTISGHTTSGTTVTWWKDGSQVTHDGDDYTIAGATLATKIPGTYYAKVMNGCSVATNNIKVVNRSADVSVKKLVNQWYIKNGRLTPDIPLFELGEGCSFVSAKADDEDLSDELGGCTVYQKEGSNIVYLQGKAPSGMTVGNVSLTIVVEDVCGNTDNSSAITIHKQIATDKHELAFVVSGTDYKNKTFTEDAWTAGVKASQSTGLALYQVLKDTFKIQTTNIYATDSIQQIREYYSQFDLICITDYPNTGTKGKNGRSYVDAIGGAMIDVRPLLTMEAYVSGLDNWRAKGVIGSRTTPSKRQYNMMLQCKDHEIFEGTTLKQFGYGDDALYQVNIVDSTAHRYTDLDATSKSSHASDTAALQGFTVGEMKDLLPLGTTDNGSGTDLQVGVERQKVMAARMMVLGINSYAMERLSKDGKQIIVNALQYLTKKRSEDISDCSSYFTNADGDNEWSNPLNWRSGTVPTSNQEARITQPVIISDTRKIASIKIATDGTFNDEDVDGSMTIASTGMLIVKGKVQAVTGPDFMNAYATSAEDVTIEASETSQGALVLNNEDGTTKATVEMYSKAGYEDDGVTPNFAYVGVPVSGMTLGSAFSGAEIWYYDESNPYWWSRCNDSESSNANFMTYCISHWEPQKFTMSGTLAPTGTQNFTLSVHSGGVEGDNMIANSWTAPIDIAQFDEDDFDGADATLYMYRTGHDDVRGTGEEGSGAGKWASVSVDAAKTAVWPSELRMIPSMQAFDIVVSSTHTLTMDYDRLVRANAYSYENGEGQATILAPKRRMTRAGKVDPTEVEALRLVVSGETTGYDVYLFAHPSFSDAFDNGWDARHMEGGELSNPLLCVPSELGNLDIAAISELAGQVLKFVPSNEREYTFSMTYEGDNELYLNDIKLEKSTRIQTGNTYDFIWENGDGHNRFMISSTPFNAPQTATGVTNLDAVAPKAQKILYNDKVYIIRGGKVYSIDGALVK